MSLKDEQVKFARMVPLLIQYALLLGYEVTLGDAYRDPRVTYGHATSLHRVRLAIDLNLFKDGEYLESSHDHLPLGKYWESIGGTWGGRFTPPDGNHYSLAYAGMK